MKKREVYLINNNHGIIIITDDKHYLYIKNSNFKDMINLKCSQ